jgi:hypothetical protein
MEQALTKEQKAAINEIAREINEMYSKRNENREPTHCPGGIIPTECDCCRRRRIYG